jgi:hypothetical protein
MKKECKFEEAANKKEVLNAAISNNIKKIKILLKDTGNDYDYEPILEVLLKNDSCKLIKYLLEESKWNPTEKNTKIIHESIKNKAFNVAKILLKDDRIDPSVKRNRATYEALILGSNDILDAILKNKKFNPERGRSDIFNHVIFNNNIYFLKSLLNDNRTIYLKTTVGGIKPDFEIIKLLINSDKVCLENYDSILLNSCQKGYIDIVKLLLDSKKINPTYNNNQFIIAAHHNEEKEVVALFWDYKNVRKELQKDDAEIYEYLMKKNIQNKLNFFI